VDRIGVGQPGVSSPRADPGVSPPPPVDSFTATLSWLLGVTSALSSA
jgi:hypothetical protein